MSDAGGADKRENFIPRGDRPEVSIDPDTPMSDLTVGDLSALIRREVTKSPFFENKTLIKDFFDKDPNDEVFKDLKEDIKEKPEKLEKVEKDKHEKPENKIEHFDISKDDEVVKPDERGPDPMVERLMGAVIGLTRLVDHLSNQIDELGQPEK